MEKFWSNLPVLISYGMYREIVKEAESLIDKLESYQSEIESIFEFEALLKEIRLVEVIRDHAKCNV